MTVTRRTVLGGIAALAVPGTARAQAAVRAQGVGDLIAAAQLGGQVGFVVVDPRAGKVLEAHNETVGMAPASTVKTITSLYALESLGPEFRFPTRLIATGPVSGGQLRGDLILSGGGDPTLSTDDLADMAARLAAAGVRRVTGRFLVWGGALPYAEEICDDQPVHVGYNPAISGLNLNFNRVCFEWKQGKGGYAVSMDARGAKAVPRVTGSEVTVTSRAAPLFTYARQNGRERWTVAQGALGKSGSRWLPVRDPAGYAGEVFRTLARGQGIDLPAPQRIGAAPSGKVLVERGSAPLTPLLRDMMKHSTNLTAETIGMTTSLRLGQAAALGASGAAMSGWFQQRLGRGPARFVDHSGLGADNRIAPIEMVRAVALLGPRVGLRGLMKPFALRDANGRMEKDSRIKVDAKTGTLNFVSTLTGYATVPGGRDLVFAIFTQDLARRARSGREEQPKGGAAWVARSKNSAKSAARPMGVALRLSMRIAPGCAVGRR
ncbi:D-alanyl-D-alanine carboxypeptidase/D-alanyl-D-alanine endopeptidase [Paenirhodobacter sp.]|uniref:D-alanyl-D-alanine carboxypeptidase/D-alanyl-D-alanine endopeptidase n=1 Tax=Paenirhodobacter sp. TaxID=1965326 RepID=UPI003B50CAB7